MAKKHKEHDQTVSDSHEGFREGVTHYSYSFEHRGHMATKYTDIEEVYEIGQEVEGKRIRNIQRKWMYGTFLTLVHLEEIDND
jgi:uncharacterized protein YnzC (UPF0291/DUF896 family)